MRGGRAGLAACLLGGLLIVGAGRVVRADGPGDARRALAERVRALDPRRGLSHRGLVLVPLVLTVPPEADAPALGPEGLAWRPAGADAVTIERPPSPGGAAGPAQTLLPSGTVLHQDAHAHMLARPVRLVGEGSATVPRLALASEPKQPPALAEASRTFGPLAPLSFRFAAFAARDAETLGHLLSLSAVLVGLEGAGEPVGLQEIAAHTPVAARVQRAATAIGKLGDAYGGEVAGHVVLLGNRVVEVVATSAPTTWRGYLREELDGLALSLVLWEELYGRDGPEEPEPDWPACLREARRVLSLLADAALARERGARPDSDGGGLWRVRVRLRAGRLPEDVGWLALGARGRVLLLEAWPDVAKGPFPVPAREPGARPVDEDPYDRLGGALTGPFLARFLARLAARAGTGGR